MQHHYIDYDSEFGVSGRFWDTVFGTELEVNRVRKKQTIWRDKPHATLPIIAQFNDLSKKLRSYTAYLGPTMLQTWNSLREPALEEGKVRVRWTCQCREKLWDDFKELVPGATEQLRQDLDGKSSMIRGSLQHISNEVQRPDKFQLTPAVDMKRTRSSLSTAGNAASPSGSDSERSQKPMPAGIGMSVTGRPSLDKKFLLLCVARRRDTLRLVQLNVEHVQSDFNLFRMIRKVYKDHRTFMERFLSPRKLISINFRKV